MIYQSSFNLSSARRAELQNPGRRHPHGPTVRGDDAVDADRWPACRLPACP